MSNLIEIKIDELVRDLTLVGFPTPKSAIKRRINEILDLQRQMIINKISKRELEMGDGGDCTGNDYLTAKQLGLDEAIEIIKSIK